MTELTRRSVLTRAAAASAATVLTPIATNSPAIAAAPAAGKQAPAFYRYKVGSIECTQLADGIAVFPLADGFVKNVNKEEVSKALEAAYLPAEKMTVFFNPLVVNAGSKLVVIDTGYGPAQPNQAALPVQRPPLTGHFHDNLAAAGIDRKSVDIVIISHFHPDHVGGLLDASGASAFPNAEISVPAPEAAFWMDDGNMSRAQGPLLAGFKNNRRVMDAVSKQLTRYEWNKEVAPGLTSIGTAGHTPGHTSFVVASGDSKVFIQSDVTNNPYLFVRNPGWHIVYDMDGPKAEETRRKFYDMAAAEKALIAGFHFPFPSLGHVEKDGSNNYRLVPIAWQPTI
jgi:glyoxylase-like metal-dependent hydrolase (beta-lactamase superfamily II)